MKRFILAAALSATTAFAQDAQPETAPSVVPAATPAIAEPLPQNESEPLDACQIWEDGGSDGRKRGLLEGPAAIGYGAPDFTVGRRACARNEVGLGANMGLVVDRPNFYGNIAAQGLLYGSYAITRRTEVFGTLAFVDYQSMIGALSQSAISVGDMNVGVNHRLYSGPKLVGSLVGRVLLPTNSLIPNSRTMGAEVGHAVSLHVTTWLEAHAYAGVGFNLGLSAAPLPNLLALGLLGVQFWPTDWFALVVDVSGGITNRTFFAPTIALRFRLGVVGLELGGTLPLAGSDRHLALAGLRLTYRF